jgi:uncharacterized cupin superfamily protein
LNEKIPEATLVDGATGRVPEGGGWFVVNAAEAAGMSTERFGAAAGFEGAQRFAEFGINVRVLAPGQPASLYHRENAQEAYLVVSGSAVAIVEEQERTLGPGDLLHLPAGTAHVLVGGGDGPAIVVMCGTRKTPPEYVFPVSAAAARHDASVAEETDDPRVAYAGMTPPAFGPVDIPWPR